MDNSGRTAADKRPDGMPVGTPFKKGESGNPNGRPAGIPDLKTHIQNIMNGKVALPDPIKETLIKAVGGERTPLEATIIVGMLQALQGDKGWGQLLWEHGWDKPTQRNQNEHTGKDGGAIVVASAHDKDILDKL
jgi:hypothetical protein